MFVNRKLPGPLAWVVIASMTVFPDTIGLAQTRGNEPPKRAVGEIAGGEAEAAPEAGKVARAAHRHPGEAETRVEEEAVVVRTNQKYNHDCFWAGPKGVNYGRLPDAQPIQKPALYPDQFSTYFVAQFKMPENAYLEITGEYPHERYFSFTVATQLPHHQLGNGDYLRDDQINPDQGSFNPFRPPNPRDIEPRKYTVQIVPGERPENSPRNDNKIYAGAAGGHVHLAMRNYVNDRGYDGTGAAKVGEAKYGLPSVTLVMDGKRYSREADVCSLLHTTSKAEAKGFAPEPWLESVAFSVDPINAPAKPTPVWEVFWDTNYSINGFFAPDPITREALYPATGAGGFANNPDTHYLQSVFSLGFGSVIVIQGKMPTFPRTKDGEKLWPETAPQVRYWSACTGGAPPSGAGWDCVYDEEVQLDGDDNYLIVVSRREDRPSNARGECGVTWLSFGPGEDIPRDKGGYEGARPWVNFVYMRFMDPDDDWKNSPAKIPLPTMEDPYPQEAYVMQEYFPASHYETTVQFESHGCPVPTYPPNQGEPGSGSLDRAALEDRPSRVAEGWNKRHRDLRRMLK